jgi:glycosyltransferase involved in cell wall biosynthesis
LLICCTIGLSVLSRFFYFLHQKLVTNKQITVAAFSAGYDAPAARFRIRQYIPYAEIEGIYINEIYSKVSCYPPIKGNKLAWASTNLYETSFNVGKYLTKDYDYTLVQRGFYAGFYTFEAIWLTDKGFLKNMLNKADIFFCGNSYLANYIDNNNRKNIHIIPTAVNTQDYEGNFFSFESRIIVWSGSSSGYQYLEPLINVFNALSKSHGAILKIISDTPPHFLSNINNVRFIKWNKQVEIEALRNCTVGIMPIADNEWSRGKCSFKMLSYMAAGLPVVVSNIGMNADVLRMGDIGIGVLSINQWHDALCYLLTDIKQGQLKGMHGRLVVETSFDTQKNAQRICDILS